MAISDLIISEDGGRAVGLEGGWGAGKSTIVRLVAEKLKGTSASSTRIAVFDAWAHQGDPLRRTFLEQLIQCMQDAGWVDRDEWDERAAGARRPIGLSLNSLASASSSRSHCLCFQPFRSARRCRLVLRIGADPGRRPLCCLPVGHETAPLGRFKPTGSGRSFWQFSCTANGTGHN